MQKLFYGLLTRASKRFGDVFFMYLAGMIAAGYFFFLPWKTITSVRFYRAMYPDRSALAHLWQAFRQYQSFTHVFLDRFLLQEEEIQTWSSEGLSHLREVIHAQKGGVLLMSHMGNWEVAAHLLKKELAHLKLMLYMGRKQKEQIEALQKKSLQGSGICIKAVDPDGGSPMDIVEGLRFIREGGLVSLTGDRLWHAGQRKVAVCFLNRQVWLPQAPYLLALLSGTPLLVFSAMRTGRRKYHFTCSPPVFLSAATRKERAEAIQAAAKVYGAILETQLFRHPFQWYHFEPFLGPRVRSGSFSGHAPGWIKDRKFGLLRNDER